MILEGRNAQGARITLDACELPQHGRIVGDWEITAVATQRPEIAARWIAARIAAWKAAHGGKR